MAAFSELALPVIERCGIPPKVGIKSAGTNFPESTFKAAKVAAYIEEACFGRNKNWVIWKKVIVKRRKCFRTCAFYKRETALYGRNVGFVQKKLVL